MGYIRFVKMLATARSEFRRFAKVNMFLSSVKLCINLSISRFSPVQCLWSSHSHVPLQIWQKHRKPLHADIY